MSVRETLTRWRSWPPWLGPSFVILVGIFLFGEAAGLWGDLEGDSRSSQDLIADLRTQASQPDDLIRRLEEASGDSEARDRIFDELKARTDRLEAERRQRESEQARRVQRGRVVNVVLGALLMLLGAQLYRSSRRARPKTSEPELPSPGQPG